MTFPESQLLLKGLDVGDGAGLDLLNHLLVTVVGSELFLEIKPLLEEEASLLGLQLLVRVNGDNTLLATLQAKDPLEETAHLLRIADLDFQVEKHVPQVDALGEGGQQTLEHSATTLDVTVLRAELELRELGGRLNVSVRGERLQSTREESAGTVWGGHGVEEEAGVVVEELGGLGGDLLLESIVEEITGFLWAC